MEFSTNRVLSAVLFVNTATMTMDVYSSVHSSPFTVENVAGNEEKQAACWKYVRHAMLIGGLYGAAAAVIAGWPEGLWAIVGTVAAEAYMFKLYSDALRIAAAKGNVQMSWSSSSEL